MDLRSRFVVGYRMVERLDGGTVMLALREAWRRYGMCSAFYYDNGSEIVNKDALGKVIYRGHLEMGAWDGYFDDLSVGLIRARALNPEGKAPIERSFSTDSHSFLNLWPGHTGGNLGNHRYPKDNDRIRQEIKNDELLTWDEGVALVSEIYRAYNGKPHDGLGGRRPVDVFNELYGKTADGLGEHPPVFISDRVLDFAMRRKEETTITADGVKLMKVKYRPVQGGGDEAHQQRLAYTAAIGCKGHVDYDPDDMNQVHLYKLDNSRQAFDKTLYT